MTLVTRRSEHALEVNTPYPVLPAQVHIRLGFSRRLIPITFAADKSLRLALRALTVRSRSCYQAQETCAGRIQVELFRDPSAAHISAPSDLPLLYYHSPIRVALSTSLGLQKTLTTAESTHSQLNLATLTILPERRTSPNTTTELIRVETHTQIPPGVTSALTSDKPTILQLLPGEYVLTSYLSSQEAEADFRTKKITRKPFSLRAHQNLTLKARFYRSAH